MLTRLTSLALLAVLATISGGLGWARLVQAEQPHAVLEVMPWHPGALIESVEASRLEGNATSAEVSAAGARMLRMAPLLDAPLVYFGFDQAAKGEREHAAEAFEAAVKRQPRNIPALSWLATEAVQRRDYNGVMALLDQLSRVDPQNADKYADALAGLLSDPHATQVFIEAFERRSPLAIAATGRMISASNDVDLLMRLSLSAPHFRQRVIDRLVRERGLEAAFIAWLTFLPRIDAESLSWPHDPAFVGSDAPTPFNWQVMEGAERLKEGGLLVRYTGRGKPVFVRQAVLLGPGSYRLAAEMDGEMSDSGGSLIWRVKCQPGDLEIATIPVLGLARTLSTQSTIVIVPPSGCPVQVLTLEGAPGTLTNRVRASVRRVTFKPLEGDAR